MEVKTKRKYTRKMNNEPTTLAEELERVKVEPSPPKREPESSEIPAGYLDYLLAAATEHFGSAAVKTYCKIRGFVDLANLVHPDDWPKLADTLKKM